MRRAVAIAAMFAALGVAHAQQRPDAGTTLRDTQQPTPAPSKPAPPAPRIEAPARPALSAPAAARFQVKNIRVTGSSAFPAARLEELVREFAGRELGLAELQEAAARITRFYRENGYPVARATCRRRTCRSPSVPNAFVCAGQIEFGSSVSTNLKISFTLRVPSTILEELSKYSPCCSATIGHRCSE